MEALVYIAMVLVGLLLGSVLSSFFYRSRMSEKLLQSSHDNEKNTAVLNERLTNIEKKCCELSDELSASRKKIEDLEGEKTNLKIDRSKLEITIEKERKSAREKLSLLDEAREQLSNAFKALSAEALKSNNRAFIEFAQTAFSKLQEGADGDLEKRQQAIEQMMKPVQECLSKFGTKINEIEKERVGAYEGLNQQVKSLIDSQQQLRSETTNLVKALRTPQVRGRWGEIQLKRVVELAGMLNYCDFREQPSVSTESGRLRPDMVINLPSGKTLVVDSKVPLSSYLDGIDSKDEAVRALKLQEHARRIREHITELSKKSYWDQFSNAPEFVVLFLPGEVFFSAALQEDPSLIELGVGQRVIIATPTTLIALLKAVAYGWKQENLAENSKMIGDLGKALYKRISDMSSHFSNLGQSLQKAVGCYNKALGSLETRVLVSARRFCELDVADENKPIHPLVPVDSTTRQFQTPEMSEKASDSGDEEEKLT
ncbi:MAG: DNA recombination protein RmuC [Nitrospiria bacterium]